MKTFRIKKFFIFITTLMLQFSVASQAVEFEIQSGNDSESDKTTRVNFLIPYNSESDEFIWSGLIGFSSQETSTRHYNTLNPTMLTLADGSANYFNVGVEGRTLLFNSQRIEGLIRAIYGFRDGGSFQNSRYTQITGKIYDPQSGLNAGAGVQLNLHGNSILVGLSYMKNFGGIKTSAFLLNIGYRIPTIK